MTLSGATTYTGNTTITGGTLVIAGGGCLGNTAITAQTGSTLRVNGSTAAEIPSTRPAREQAFPLFQSGDDICLTYAIPELNAAALLLDVAGIGLWLRHRIQR